MPEIRLNKRTKTIKIVNRRRNIRLQHTGKTGPAGSGGAGASNWGDLGGTLSDQTDLQSALDAKVPTTRTVNGHDLSANVSVTASDVGLGNVDNTSDATKNSAIATLTNKTLTSPIINTPTGIVKGDVGLGSVDNTSDLNKPISTATQSALDTKLESVVAGTNVTVDNTDPLNPVVSATGGGGGSALEVDDEGVLLTAGATKVDFVGGGVTATNVGTNVTVTVPADAVSSVNTKTGAVVINPDDLDDTATTHKFVTAAEKSVIAATSGTNTGDQDLSTYQLKPAEGAFVDGDKTKLDGIATGATANSKATATELDTGTDDAKFATALGLKNAHNIPSVAPSTAGKLMRSDGTDWTSASVTTADIAASTNKNYVTDAQQTVLGNTSGTNTGDQDLSSYATKTGAETISNKTVDNTNSITVKDTSLTVQDNTDTSKQVQLELSGITTATTRTLAVPDADGTIALTSNLSSYQPLDSDLTTIAGLTATTDNIIQSSGSAWSSRTPTQVTSTLNNMVGDSGSGGTKGLVPAPAAGDAAASKFLKADGTWTTVSATSPLTTNGDLYYYNGGDARLPIGSSGTVLSVNAGLPSWGAVPSDPLLGIILKQQYK